MGFKKGYKQTEEQKQKLREAATGRHPSEETRLKMSLALMGNTRRLGQYPSEETRLKISLAGIGRVVSEETRLKKRIAGLKRRHSDATKLKISLANKGENSGKWKGGRRKTLEGYILILISKHPFINASGCVPEHRLVMEEYLGRYLLPEEIVHHINEIKDDNRIENLELFKNSSEHQSYHKRLRDLKCQTSI